MSGDGRRKPAIGASIDNAQKSLSVHNVQVLFDLFAQDSSRNVYTGEREVHPPFAPTTGRWTGWYGAPASLFMTAASEHCGVRGFSAGTSALALSNRCRLGRSVYSE